MAERDADINPADEEALEAQVFTALAAAVRPVEPDAVTRERLRGRVLDGVRAKPPAGTKTIRASEGEWRTILPRVEIKVLNRDEQSQHQTLLYRLRPGAVLPRHTHQRDEECLVLEGEVQFGDYRLHAGDFHLARAGFEHPTVTSRSGALLLITQALAA